MDFDYTTFRKNLKALMESRGFSNLSFAEEIGITAPAISRYLTGNRKPELPYVVKIAQYFNVPIDWLLGLNGDRFDIMPQELQEVVYCYSLATLDDRHVVQAVLQKYKSKQ